MNTDKAFAQMKRTFIGSDKGRKHCREALL
jgi:hypothetical protein